MILTKTNTAKFVAVFAGLAVALAFLFAPASDLRAQTVDELQAQIAALMAQIEGLQGQPSGTGIDGISAGFQFTQNLTEGSTGTEVRYLQKFLNAQSGIQVAASGPGSPGMETTTFGPLTRTAVSAYQSANNISPTAGYFGPLTRASVNSKLAAAPAPDPTPTDECPEGYMMNPAYTPGSVTTPMCVADDEDMDDMDDHTTPGLQGGEGSLDITDLTVGTVDLDLGESGSVIEMEVEAMDSDVALNRVDFHFTQAENGSPGVARPWLYFSEVRLVLDGDVIGSLSGTAGNFTEISRSGQPNDYRARFSGLNEVIQMGEVKDLELEVTVRNSMTGDREEDDVTVTMLRDAIRFVDAAGIIQFAPSDDGDIADVDISFSEATEGSLDVTLADNSPESATIVVDEDNQTNNQTVLIFDVEAKNQDVEINEMDVKFTVGTSTNVNDVLRRARLYADGSLLRTKNLGTGTNTTVNFDNLSYVVNQNSEVEFEVRVDFWETSRAGFTVPETLEIELQQIQGIDEDFFNVTESNLQIGAGEVHDVIEEGLIASIVSKSQTTEADGEVGKFTFVLDLTAHGSAFRLAEDGSFASSASGPASATTSASSIVNTNASSVTEGGTPGYRINNGQTRQFTVEVFINDVDETGQYRVTLNTLEYGVSGANFTGQPLLQLGAPDFRSGQLTILE